MPISSGDFVRLQIPKNSDLHKHTGKQALVYHVEGRGAERKAAVMLMDGTKPPTLLVPIRWATFEEKWMGLRGAFTKADRWDSRK